MLLLIAASSFMTILILFQMANENLSISEKFQTSLSKRFIKEKIFNRLSHSKETVASIECSLPNNKSVKCLKKNGKLFVSLDFVAKKFDVINYFA